MDPRKKKEESLKHDRRNTYGENDKSSRKSIRRRKQWVNRVYRHKVHQALGTRDAEEIQESVSEIRRPPWKKEADEPLGDVLLRDLIREICSHIYTAPPGSLRFDRLEQLMREQNWEEPGIRVVMRQLRSVALIAGSCKLDVDLPTARELIILWRKVVSEQAISNSL